MRLETHMWGSVLGQSRREEGKIGGAPAQERCMPVLREERVFAGYRLQSGPPAQGFSGYPGG